MSHPVGASDNQAWSHGHVEVESDRPASRGYLLTMACICMTCQAMLNNNALVAPLFKFSTRTHRQQAAIELPPDDNLQQ